MASLQSAHHAWWQHGGQQAGSLGPVAVFTCAISSLDPILLHSRWHSLIRHHLGVLGTQAHRPHWNLFCTQTIKASKPGQCLGYILKVHLTLPTVREIEGIDPFTIPCLHFPVIQEVSSLESVRSPTPRGRDKNTHLFNPLYLTIGYHNRIHWYHA